MKPGAQYVQVHRNDFRNSLVPATLRVRAYSKSQKADLDFASHFRTSPNGSNRLFHVQPTTATGSGSAYLKVGSNLTAAVPSNMPTSMPEADMVCGAVVLVTTNKPGPGGSASMIEGGIVNCPALDGAWQ